MFTKFALASATAALALTIATPSFDGAPQSFVQSAEAKSGFQLVQNRELRKGPLKHGAQKNPKGSGGLEAQGQRKPQVELVPSPYYPAGTFGFVGKPGTGYCMPSNGQGLAMGVRFNLTNTGNQQAGAFKILFDFGNSQYVLDRPLHPVGSTIIMDAAIPASAWKNGKMDYTIRVDHGNAVKETNEANNVFSGSCFATWY